MKTLPVATALFAVLVSAGCSNSASQVPTPIVSSAYPTDAATVTSDPAYKRAFLSGLSGIAYYFRRLAKDEISKMPKDRVIIGETESVVFVPIKDGKIVGPTVPDRGGQFFSLSPEKMLETLDSN